MLNFFLTFFKPYFPFKKLNFFFIAYVKIVSTQSFYLLVMQINQRRRQLIVSYANIEVFDLKSQLNIEFNSYFLQSRLFFHLELFQSS
jgi:hypothetical protein